MEYNAIAHSLAKQDAVIHIKEANVQFGITAHNADLLPNPAEILLGSLGACILKSVERFSMLMHFDYATAEVKLHGVRLEKPPSMEHIDYTLTIRTNDTKINVGLLQRNIEGFGTIFNTVKAGCTIEGRLMMQKVE